MFPVAALPKSATKSGYEVVVFRKPDSIPMFAPELDQFWKTVVLALNG